MATHRVTLIPGDGTATRRVLEVVTAGSRFDGDVQQAGVDIMETAGTPLPSELGRAVADVIAEGASVTYDLKPTRTDPTAVGTAEYADAVIKKLGS